MRVQSGGGCANVRVDQDLKNFSADVISRACFGSSFSKGKDIFAMLRVVQKAIAKQSFMIGIPGLRFSPPPNNSHCSSLWPFLNSHDFFFLHLNFPYIKITYSKNITFIFFVRYIPIKTNREIWRHGRKIKSLIMEIVREKSTAGNDDLLQALMRGTMDGRISPEFSHDFLVDNCKAIYFAGQETTATALSWVLFLLALHPDWQKRVREEVHEVFGTSSIDVEGLAKMKVVRCSSLQI